MNIDEPFGGKLVVCSGDFRQCLPIKQKATRTELIDLSITQSYLWDEFVIFHLTENMRSDQDSQMFASQLLRIGEESKEKMMLSYFQMYVI